MEGTNRHDWRKSREAVQNCSSCHFMGESNRHFYHLFFKIKISLYLLVLRSKLYFYYLLIKGSKWHLSPAGFKIKISLLTLACFKIKISLYMLILRSKCHLSHAGFKIEISLLSSGCFKIKNSLYLLVLRSKVHFYHMLVLRSKPKRVVVKPLASQSNAHPPTTLPK